jgi:hypothetical protein
LYGHVGSNIAAINATEPCVDSSDNGIEVCSAQWSEYGDQYKEHATCRDRVLEQLKSGVIG